MKVNNLFLDDIRNPIDVYSYIHKDIYIFAEWQIVRNYNEFVKFIEGIGMPELISFDHDLADSHYTPKEYWDDYNKSAEWQDAQVHEEKTGYECAAWLVDYCIDNELKLPEFLCHSMNPVGKERILNLLNNYEKHVQ